MNAVSCGSTGGVCVRYPTKLVHCIATKVLVCIVKTKKINFVPLGVVVVVVVVHIIFPDEPEKISFLLAVDFCHAPQRVWEKALAPWNMTPILITLDTSHFEISPLNDVAW